MCHLFKLFVFMLLIACGGGGSFQAPSFPEKSNVQAQTIDGANSVFLSYDDSGSTAISQLLKYQIENGETVSADLAKPHELLNAEKFDEIIGFDEIGEFNISLGILKNESKEFGKELIDLGFHIKGPQFTLDSRPNLVLTFLVDVSGSMGATTGAGSLSSGSKIKLVKEGMVKTFDLLKEGDVINIVSFNSNAQIVFENYIHGGSNKNTIIEVISDISALGSTNLEKGLELAYSMAVKYYDNKKKNRVLLLTDAHINAGETNATTIAKNKVIDNEEGILLSGVGIGFDFNGAFLEELTDAGSGNQFLAATDADVENIFSGNFLSLLMVAAKNFKVELRYPDRLEHIASAAEEIASDENDLKGVNFSYNSSQYFLERFRANIDALIGSDEFTVVLTYDDVVTGAKISLEKVYLAENLYEKQDKNIKDALSIVFLTNLIVGTKDWEDITWQFEHVFKDHQSEIYNEFKKLMYLYYGVDSNDTF